jgi:ABC-type transporter Mla maintaining outer membrane lipid asymmetry ATPase subunit MlaF
MLRNGKIIFEGTDEALHRTEDAYIQRFIRGH